MDERMTQHPANYDKDYHWQVIDDNTENCSDDARETDEDDDDDGSSGQAHRQQKKKKKTMFFFTPKHIVHNP